MIYPAKKSQELRGLRSKREIKKKSLKSPPRGVGKIANPPDQTL